MPNEKNLAARSVRAPRWYVIQVSTGKENAMCELILRVAPERTVEECFSPSYDTQIKVKGEWRSVKKPLLPGYLIAVTDQVEVLQRVCRTVPEFARLLTMGETFVPLRDDDQAWIGAFTRRGERSIPMSTGVMEGDRVLVLDGPLVGREALIKSVNRHKSLAFLEFEICGRKVTTKVGLGIVRKKNDGSGDSGARNSRIREVEPQP